MYRKWSKRKLQEILKRTFFRVDWTDWFIVSGKRNRNEFYWNILFRWIPKEWKIVQKFIAWKHEILSILSNSFLLSSFAHFQLMFPVYTDPSMNSYNAQIVQYFLQKRVYFFKNISMQNGEERAFLSSYILQITMTLSCIWLFQSNSIRFWPSSCYVLSLLNSIKYSDCRLLQIFKRMFSRIWKFPFWKSYLSVSGASFSWSVLSCNFIWWRRWCFCEWNHTNTGCNHQCYIVSLPIAAIELHVID